MRSSIILFSNPANDKRSMTIVLKVVKLNISRTLFLFSYFTFAYYVEIVKFITVQIVGFTVQICLFWKYNKCVTNVVFEIYIE